MVEASFQVKVKGEVPPLTIETATAPSQAPSQLGFVPVVDKEGPSAFVTAIENDLAQLAASVMVTSYAPAPIPVTVLVVLLTS